MGEEELRLGNWVSNTHGIPMIVKAIYKDTVYVDFKGNIGGLWEFNRHEPFKPIELTEEILSKCGFDNKDNVLFRNEHVDLIFNCDFEYIWIYDKNLKDCICVKCKYLHQLQNLYFALTGQELIINL